MPLRQPSPTPRTTTNRPPRAFLAIGLMSAAGLVGVPLTGAAVVGMVTDAAPNPIPAAATPVSTAPTTPASPTTAASPSPTTPSPATPTSTPPTASSEEASPADGVAASSDDEPDRGPKPDRTGRRHTVAQSPTVPAP